MRIDEESLLLAKRGEAEPERARKAAMAIVRIAWKVAYGIEDSFMREMTDLLAEDLLNVAEAPSQRKDYTLRDAVLRNNPESNDPEPMMQLLSNAWDAAHNPYDVERWTRLMFLIGVLFLMANYGSATSGTTLVR